MREQEGTDEGPEAQKMEAREGTWKTQRAEKQSISQRRAGRGPRQIPGDLQVTGWSLVSI